MLWKACLRCYPALTGFISFICCISTVQLPQYVYLNTVSHLQQASEVDAWCRSDPGDRILLRPNGELDSPPEFAPRHYRTPLIPYGTSKLRARQTSEFPSVSVTCASLAWVRIFSPDEPPARVNLPSWPDRCEIETPGGVSPETVFLLRGRTAGGCGIRGRM